MKHKKRRFSTDRVRPVKVAVAPSTRPGYQTIDISTHNQRLWAGIEFDGHGAARYPQQAVFQFANNLKNRVRFITEKGVALTGAAPQWARSQALLIISDLKFRLMLIDAKDREIKLYRLVDLPAAA